MQSDDPQELFHYWIAERLKVLHKKEELRLPKPWSDDPVFHNTYFCNVRREDDKVTRWIRHTYPRSRNSYLDTAWFDMLVARFVNKPSTLEELGWPFGGWSALPRMMWMEVMSMPGAWGSAYIVSTNGRPMAKHEYIADVLDAAWQHNESLQAPKVGGTLSGLHSAIQRVPGVGSFIGAQVVADLKNTKGHWCQQAPDWYTFSSHGPGSLRGLGWYFGVRVTPTGYQEFIEEAWNDLPDHLAEEVVCMQNLQNCFCEFDKYMRVRSGTGRSKRKYNGN